VNPRPLSSYVRDIRPQLPARAFEPVPTRLAWLAFHVTVAALGIVAIARGLGGPWAAPFFSLAIGHAFAGCAFVGHETLHGAVVRDARLRTAIGWLCFAPFVLSPRLWVAWHNRTHHGHTMEDGVDPDAYPTLAQYRKSRVTRVADFFSFGRGRPLGVLVTLALGFTGQSQQMLWRWSPNGLDRSERRKAIAETLAGVAMWTLLAFALGFPAFIFAYLIPLAIANAIVMSYILTNHSLSPYTEVNDPLLNTLTVTAPRVVEWLHLDFGLHVEHHLFPSMSSKFAPLVRAELLARFPDRYQSLPLLTALARLATTPRVYATPTLLRDPLTGSEAATLGSLANQPLLGGRGDQPAVASEDSAADQAACAVRSGAVHRV
jgi:fatty acid desaturase